MTVERIKQAAAAMPDPELSAFLANAAARIEHGLGAAEAFELSGSGALKRRDDLIRQAAALLDVDSAWQAAELLRRRLLTLQYRNRHDAADRLLVAAARCGKIPTSRRRIYDALARADDRIRGFDDDRHPRGIDAAGIDG